MNLVPLELEHLARMRIQKQQQRDGFFALDTYRAAGECFAGVLGDKPLFCVGRAHGDRAWAILSEDASRHMVAVTRAVKDLIRRHGDSYLEILVRPDFKQAHRWAAMLGFTKRDYNPTYDMFVYARGIDFAREVLRVTAMMSALPVPVRMVPDVTNTFSDGLYTRRLFIPKGTLVVGKIHLWETLNICAKGDITVMTEKGLSRFRAGEVMVSAPGIQKIGYAHEDTVWVNVFSTGERDLHELEVTLFRDPAANGAESFIELFKESIQ